MNAASQKGLGKGLSALMGEEYSQTMGEEEKGTTVVSPSTLPLADIHSGKFQPRTHFDEEYLNELADSIEKNGVMQPIIVRPSPDQGGKYEIIAGERRWRASKLANLDVIPVIIRDIDDQLALELALVENIQRQDLNPLEEAAGYQRLIDEFSYTQEELARTVGKSRSHIANLLRLLDLPKEIKTMLEKDQLSMGHARALLGSDKAIELAKKVIKEDLNVRQTELLVKTGSTEVIKDAEPKANSPKSASTDRPSRPRKEKDPDILALEATLSDNLGLSVSIDDHGSQKGEVIIQYASLSQLDDILRRLGDSI